MQNKLRQHRAITHRGVKKKLSEKVTQSWAVMNMHDLGYVMFLWIMVLRHFIILRLKVVRSEYDQIQTNDGRVEDTLRTEHFLLWGTNLIIPVKAGYQILTVLSWQIGNLAHLSCENVAWSLSFRWAIGPQTNSRVGHTKTEYNKRLETEILYYNHLNSLPDRAVPSWFSFTSLSTERSST